MTRLMRIKEAAASIGVTVPALRTEIRNGRLNPTRIAGKIFLTAEQLQDMITACQDQPKAPGSTSSATPAVSAFGLSETDCENLGPGVSSTTPQELAWR